MEHGWNDDWKGTTRRKFCPSAPFSITNPRDLTFTFTVKKSKLDTLSYVLYRPDAIFLY